jgi:hypothetical protein
LIAHCFCFCVCKPEGWRRGWTRKGRVAEEEEEEAVMSSSSCNNGAQELTAAVNNSPVDIVILTNGPSEIAAWVKPLVAALRQHTNKHFSDIHILVCCCCAWLSNFIFCKNADLTFVSSCKCGLVVKLSFNRWKTLLSKVWVEILFDED